MEGVITELGTSHAEVQIGRLRVRARLEELRGGRLQGDPQGTRPASSREDAGARRQPALIQAPPFEIDLRGRTVDEALEELDRQLDASYFAGMPFLRIIHGKGTGRLRQAIRAALKSNPYVGGFETGSDAEGGEGVTVVKLASG
jgi:DNA mismatch repair protein MutS2